MFKYLWILTLVVLILFLIILTINAVNNIIKDMHEGDDIFDFFESFMFDYPGIVIFWAILIVGVFIISIIAWIISKCGG